MLDPADFVATVDALVRADERWVPDAEGEKSLYLRPFMYGSAAFLGLRPSSEVKYSVIASPAASIFTGGPKPVTLWVAENFARAGAGGTGPRPGAPSLPSRPFP